MVINIERQITSESPCRELADRADQIRGRPGVLAASIVLGFAYADVPEMGTSSSVTTDGDADLAQACANELGQCLWQSRESCCAKLISAKDAVRSISTGTGPTLLLDVGDNIGCATPGDGTLLVHALLEEHGAWTRAFACFCDTESVRQAHQAGVGAELTMRLGGKYDPMYGPPVSGRFRVRGLFDGWFKEPEARHSALFEYDMGPTAVVESESGLTVMLNSIATMPFSLHQLTSCRIDHKTFDVFIAKGAQAPIAAYASVCRTTIRVNTPGASTPDIETLSYHHRRRPMYPFERQTTWSPSP